MALCPAHADTNPSLHISIADDGKILVHCFTGCAPELVMGTLGLEMSVLAGDLKRVKTGATNVRGIPAKKSKSFPSVEAIVAAAARSKKGKLESTHIYKFASGEPAFGVVRVRLADGQKEIPQIRPVAGGWVFGGIKKARPLYRLPELLSAPADMPIMFFEGEQKADLVASFGFIATSCSQGAGNAKLTNLAPLAGRVVHLFPDNDKAGRDHMQDVATRCYDAGAASVLLVTLPGLPDKGDIVDFVERRRASGATDALITEEIGAAVSQAVEVERQQAEVDQEDGGGVCSPKPADLLVALAVDAVLFHDEHNETYASIPVRDHYETWRIDSSHFERWLTCRYYRTYKSAPTTTALATAILQLQAMAQFDGEQQSVHMRVARTPSALWVDLCNDKWQAVEITRSGWRVVDAPSVRFIRPPGMKALPTPVSGFGSLDPLFDLLHFKCSNERLLLTAWLVNALLAATSYPIVELIGEQGSGKTTFARALQRLIDPHEMEGRSPPRNEEDIAVAAQHAHVLIYENLSDIPQWLSDALCRLATGAAFAGRKLYTDADERQLKFCRPVIINGINDLATRSDLADRAISVQLEPLQNGMRQTEDELWSTFEAMQPRLLGTLLDLIVKVMGIDQVNAPLERMADYSRLGAKVAIALGLSPTKFSDAYRANRDAASQVAVESSAIGPVLLRLVRRQPFEGLVSGLLHELQMNANVHEQRHPNWPKTPRALGGELRRLNPNLTRLGITVRFQGHRREGHWVSIRAGVAADGHNGHDGHREPEAS